MQRTATVLLLILIAAPIAAAQTIHYVDDDAALGGDGLSWATAYDTLPPALSAGQPGDQIWVAAGTYVGNFTLALGVEMYGGFDGTETLLEQRDWADNETILDGNQSGSVVIGPPDATETTRVDGFTITGGGAVSIGGGLRLSSSSPTIANNTITENSAGKGGGLYLYSSSSTIESNTIVGNHAGYGGGLWLAFSSSLTIADNTVKGNGASYSGGGLYLFDSTPTIANNTIAGNSSGNNGGGLWLQESAPTIVNNRISDNHADQSYGGGMYLRDSSPTIANSTIVGNSSGSKGGGLYLANSSPTITNSTITGNGAFSGGGGLYEWGSSPTIANTIVAFNSSGVLVGDDGAAPTLRSNCVYGNDHYDYSGVSDPTGIDGNISTDPELANLQYENVHIQPDSPCVDAGDSAYAWGDLDIDGEPRVLPLGGIVDIGADESDGTKWAKGPNAIVRVSTEGDDTNDGSAWALAKRTIQAGIDAASVRRGDVWVRGGTYEERIMLKSYAYLYGGFAGAETMRDERDLVTNVTTIDGQQLGPVVAAQRFFRASTIDGFMITGGSVGSGGGFHLRYSSPTIANNTITGNRASSLGGGLFLSGSSSMISNNTITDNSAERKGGGACLVRGSPTIMNNTVFGNSADENGGGLHMYESSPTIANNTIVGNASRLRAGGISMEASVPTIVNTIIAFNSSGVYRLYSAPALRYNCVYGNTAYDYWANDPAGTDGNVSVDPLFVRDPEPGLDGLWGTDDDDYGDLHLSLDSPVIDAGDNAEVPADVSDLDGDGDVAEPMPFDFDGYARFMDDPLTPDTGAGSPPIVDMGAYEFGPEDCRHGGGLDHDGDVDLVNFAAFERCMTGPGAPPSPGCECFDVDDTGYVDLADVAVFQTLFTDQ